MSGNIKEIDVEISCDTNIFVIFKANFGDQWPDVLIVEAVRIQGRMFINDSNNVVGTIWIYEGRFKGFRGTDLDLGGVWGGVFC